MYGKGASVRGWNLSLPQFTSATAHMGLVHWTHVVLALSLLLKVTMH